MKNDNKEKNDDEEDNKLENMGDEIKYEKW